MRIPAVVCPETVKELGTYVDDYTYGIYTVRARRVKRSLRCNRLCKMAACTAHGRSTCPASCPRPACAKHGPKRMWEYTLTSLINDDQTRRVSGSDPVLKHFTGENATFDAVTYLIGMLQNKAELSGAREQFVDYVYAELDSALRAEANSGRARNNKANANGAERDRGNEHPANWRDQLAAGRNAMRV